MNDAVLAPMGDLRDWMVKDFPVTIRQAVTTAASRRGVTVAAFLLAHFEAHGIDGEAVKLAQVKRVNPSDDPLADLARLAREITPEGRDSHAMQAAPAVVAERLNALRMTPPAKAPGQPRRLAVPAEAAPRLL